MTNKPAIEGQCPECGADLHDCAAVSTWKCLTCCAVFYEERMAYGDRFLGYTAVPVGRGKHYPAASKPQVDVEAIVDGVVGFWDALVIYALNREEECKLRTIIKKVVDDDK